MPQCFLVTLSQAEMFGQYVAWMHFRYYTEMKKTIGERALEAHRKLKGKIELKAKAPLRSRDDLSLFYTPGVGAVSSYVAKHKKEMGEYTIKSNTIGVISDGSAVLGLGNIGPEGALPVMEGKAMIFKEFAGLDAFPIVLATQDVEEIIATVKNIAPVFGGINLEDISAPRCFEIEERLKKELDIPVMHDDQHGTAIVVLAALINAFKVVKKSLLKSTVVISGAGAAGTAIANLLRRVGAGNIIVLDSKGIIETSRSGLSPHKKKLAQFTNKKKIKGGLAEALRGADAIIGVSGPGLMNASHVRLMAKKPIVFALANPTPEILPSEALRGGAAVIGTGRSDFPNQINNALVFPGIFRGALTNKVKKITDAMKVKAALNLAALVKYPRADFIIPNVFDKHVVPAIAKAIK